MRDWTKLETLLGGAFGMGAGAPATDDGYDALADALEVLKDGGIDLAAAGITDDNCGDVLAVTAALGRLDTTVVAKAIADAEAATVERAKAAGIAPKEGGNRSMPKKWREKGLSSDDFGDPTNWKLPLHDADHVRNALARWPQMKGDYSSSEQSVIEGRLKAAAKKFKIDTDLGSKTKAVPTQEDRASECGIAIKHAVSDPPDGYEDVADVPSAWGDYTHYEFPLSTDDALGGTIKRLSTDTLDGYSGPEMNLVVANVARAQMGQLAELRAKAAAPPTPASTATATKESDDLSEDAEDDALDGAAYSDMAEAFSVFLQKLMRTDSGDDAIGKDTDIEPMLADLHNSLATIWNQCQSTDGAEDAMETKRAKAFRKGVLAFSGDMVTALVATKAGRRMSAASLTQAQAIHDHAVALGAACAAATKSADVTGKPSGAPSGDSHTGDMDTAAIELVVTKALGPVMAALETAKASAGEADAALETAKAEAARLEHELEEARAKASELEATRDGIASELRTKASELVAANERLRTPADNPLTRKAVKVGSPDYRPAVRPEGAPMTIIERQRARHSTGDAS